MSKQLTIDALWPQDVEGFVVVSHVEVKRACMLAKLFDTERLLEG